jgi:hypothetical protein
MRAIVLVVTAAALAGCAGLGSSSTPAETTYIRSDGQPVSKEQVDADQASCGSSSDKAYRCMVGKGYFLVAVQDAAAKQAQFAQIAEDNKKREEARIAEELRKQEELARAARRQAQKKKKPPARTVN